MGNPVYPLPGVLPAAVIEYGGNRWQIICENADSLGLKRPRAPVQRGRSPKSQEMKTEKAGEQSLRRRQASSATGGNAHRCQQRQPVRGFQKMPDHAVHATVAHQGKLGGEGGCRRLERSMAPGIADPPPHESRIRRGRVEQLVVRRERVIRGRRAHRHKEHVEQRNSSAMVSFGSTVIPPRNRQQQALDGDQVVRDDAGGAL